MELEQNGNYEKGYFNGISDILIVDDCRFGKLFLFDN